jgi:hypothetical protein
MPCGVPRINALVGLASPPVVAGLSSLSVRLYNSVDIKIENGARRAL